MNLIRLFHPRRRFGALCAALLLSAAAVPAQSVTWVTTQANDGGPRSQGSAQVSTGKLRVKVFPAYLDVEEEVEILATGTVRTGNDPSTLQLIATFTLPMGAAVMGALTWEGSRVLQARMFDRVKSDSVYDHLSDQDSTPPARDFDRLILERASLNTYTVKIYPVVLGASRRFRLRYQLPPHLGSEGFQIRLQGALSPASGTSEISTTLEPQAGTSSIQYLDGGTKREMTLPRTLFIPRQTLASGIPASSSVRILPVDRGRQVQVKTSFGTGAFKGHYLNLYAGVDESTLSALQRIEVVVFWKWHNPIYWKNSPSYVFLGKNQVAALLNLYGVLGVPGTRVGLLHDDSHRPQKAFTVAAQGEASYLAARAYLQSLQGDAIQNFVDSLANQGGSGGPPPLGETRSRFLANMRIVKTLYSPEEGVTRHLLLISNGPEYTTEDLTANAVFDSIFTDRPLSVGTLAGQSFTQAGLNLPALRQGHPLQGSTVSVQGTSVPAFPAVTFYATVRNAAKAYDFSLTCSGGLTVTCPSHLEFHGKSETPWSDTVQWEAYQADGKLLGRSKTRPFVIGSGNDTATAVLWAGSSAPFSEMKESPLGPTYGFVDVSGSLLAMSRDTLSSSQGGAYADTGVPSGGSMAIVVANPPPQEGPIIVSVRGMKGDAKTWRIERAGADLLSIRVPALIAGAQVEIELISLDGKRVGIWKVTAEAGAIRWNIAGVRPGTYLLRMRGPNLHGERLLTL